MSSIDYNLLTRLQNSVKTVNVLSYGAVGDGVTDDTAAINAAIKASQTAVGGSMPLVWPPGQYVFSSPILLTTGNIDWIGAGSRPGNQGGTDLIYTGPNGTDALTFGVESAALSNVTISGFRIRPSGTRTSGNGLRIINGTNQLLIDNVNIGKFPTRQFYFDTGNGGSGPGPNFVKLSRFFAIGGLVPVEFKGGRQNIVVEYGGIDLEATSTVGFLKSGGEAVAQITTVTGVKIEGSFDVPGFLHSGLGSTQFIGCTRYNYGTALTSAGPAFMFDNSAQQDCHMGILGCTTFGCTIGVYVPGRGVSMSCSSFGGYIPWFMCGGGEGSGSTASMFAPVNSTYKHVALHDQVQLAWTTAGDPKTVDTNLYRGAANVLKTDDTFQASLGVATMAKAGTPTDADWAVAPPVGTIVFDSQGSRLWVRTGTATWKSATLT